MLNLKFPNRGSSLSSHRAVVSMAVASPARSCAKLELQGRFLPRGERRPASRHRDRRTVLASPPRAAGSWGWRVLGFPVRRLEPQGHWASWWPHVGWRCVGSLASRVIGLPGQAGESGVPGSGGDVEFLIPLDACFRSPVLGLSGHWPVGSSACRVIGLRGHGAVEYWAPL